MDLSVVIVSYNVSSFLEQNLTTLTEAIRDLDVEVFVVDNASHDDSAAMVKRKYPWVNLIENDTNLGFARANNQALVRAKGSYVLLLNPDTVLRTDTLTTMVDFLDNHSEAGAAGCKVINPDGSLQLACRRGFPTPDVAFYKLTGLSGLFPKSKTFGAYNLTYLDPDAIAEVDAVSGSFMMLRKEALDQVGLLDESFFMYGEDLDICYRIKQAGWKIYYVHDTEIIHFKGESTKTVSSLKSIRDFYTAMHIFVDKHYAGRSKRTLPQWLLIFGIYARMGWVYGLNVLKKAKQPLIDLILLNISLNIGILLRFGARLENAPDYSRLEWITIFIVYSVLYMLTFYFVGMYHRHRNNPERALLGIFVGFLFNVFIVNFIKEYNFSRIASFYCWGLNSILISGWRFVYQLLQADGAGTSRSRAVVVGKISEAVTLNRVLSESGSYSFDIVGCVEISKNAIRGRETEGIHILGLVDELRDIIEEYSVDVVIMIGSHIPFSKILSVKNGFGVMRPEFKLVPELKTVNNVEKSIIPEITMIDILPGRIVGTNRST
ncbi:glycosyltransferase [Candidatus Latescibacterota bacterium]